LLTEEADLQAKLKAYLPALFCALTPVICYLIVRPYAEIGIDDDWSYIKTAQVLAQTGHIVYNGWATAMLGWQLYFGALFIKLFGFSFTAVRLSTLIEAVATAFLLERTLVRAGINEWNSVLATLAFVLSPLYLPLAVTFMTDVSGVLCIVLCLYMCLRALEAKSRRSAILWICLAALVNAVGGTARQIVWLGVLVMVPSTLWLLRRDRHVLLTGSVACIAGIGFVFAAMHWFARQPYSDPSSLIPDKIDWKGIVSMSMHGCGQLSRSMLPVLLMFIGCLPKRTRRIASVAAITSFCFVLLEIPTSIADRLPHFLAQFLVHPILFHAELHSSAVRDASLDIARDGLRLLSATATVIGFLSLLFCLLGFARDHSVPHQKNRAISWRQLGIVLSPFSVAYVILLAVFAAGNFFIVRYVLPLLAICLLVTTRYYQERVKANLPMACVALIVLAGSLAVAATHDEFALRRGSVAAIDELRSSEVPATSIWGPWEYDGWTEVEKIGYVNDRRIRTPQGLYTPPPELTIPPHCDDKQRGVPFWFSEWTPAIKPIYMISNDPTECGGPAGFSPVTYHTWLPPLNRSIYIVKLPAQLSQ